MSLAEKILTALTEEGEHEDQRENLSSGNYKQTYRHASATGQRPVYKGAQDLRLGTHETLQEALTLPELLHSSLGIGRTTVQELQTIFI